MNSPTISDNLSGAMNGGLNGDNGRAMHPIVVERLTELRRPASAFTFIDEEAASVTSAPSRNVTAEVKGERDDEIIVVGGHLDSHLRLYGAHDNGAGVAQVMAAMRKKPTPA